jgi:hypothetical protein
MVGGTTVTRENLAVPANLGLMEATVVATNCSLTFQLNTAAGRSPRLLGGGKPPLNPFSGQRKQAGKGRHDRPEAVRPRCGGAWP